jgi:hypothetical protein
LRRLRRQRRRRRERDPWRAPRAAARARRASSALRGRDAPAGGAAREATTAFCVTWRFLVRATRSGGCDGRRGCVACRASACGGCWRACSGGR